MAKHVRGVTAYTATGNTLSVASGRISFTFGLRGPALTIDTACSSSLVALHTAVNALGMNQCSRAVNLGANLMLSVDTPAAFAKSGMLSADGRCKTLDVAADGYVRAEGTAAFLLEMRENTVSKTDSDVVAVLNGTAVNQDGRSSSLTAPNGPAQTDAILAALFAGRLSPNDLKGIEMHGTGTGLGDPIEVGALAAVFETRKAPLVLFAGKSLVGHSEPAAGAMGLTHAYLAFSNMTSLPILHLTSVNNYISPITVGKQWSLPRQVGPLPQSTAIIGISSFAFQGTNVHVLASGVSGADSDVRPPTAPLTWHRFRSWVHPALHDIVSTVEKVAGSQRVNFDASFATARSAGFYSGIEYLGVPALTLGTAAQLVAAAADQ